MRRRVSLGRLADCKSYQSCSLFLVLKGKDPARVSFLPYDSKKETQFVYWKAA